MGIFNLFKISKLEIKSSTDVFKPVPKFRLTKLGLLLDKYSMAAMYYPSAKSII